MRGDDRLYERLCDAIDREDLLTDDRFETNADRWEHREVLKELLEEEFVQYERDELCEHLAAAGIPTGPVRTVDEDPHVAAHDLLTDTYNVNQGKPVETVAAPFRTSAGRLELSGQPPERGEHTRAVLGELGYDDETIRRMLAAADLDLEE